MTIRNLQYLFKPKSVAIIGASLRPNAIGTIVLQNVLNAGFEGSVFPINPKYKDLFDLPVYGSVAQLPHAPELAVICTPASTVVSLIKELGSRGTKAVIVISDGLDAQQHFIGKTIKQAMLEAAKPYLLRILGPSCVGLLVPGIGLNASFALGGAKSGAIAFVAQSESLVSGVLDWAREHEVGFSKLISLGESADIDLADVINYLATDNETEAILLYIEQIKGARKFISAARVAAQGKPVIVLKTGRRQAALKAWSELGEAPFQAGTLIDADQVADASIRRAGMLRVFSTEGLFNAAETLARAHRTCGERLAIISNGRALAALAEDALLNQEGCLANLSPSTLAALGKLLPKKWSGGNPVDILGDATPERYAQVMQIVMADAGVDAVLFLHAPSAKIASIDIALAVLPLVESARCHIFSCWLGGATVAAARALFSDAGIACYYTPERAVYGFMQIVQYRRNQALLMEVPATVAGEMIPDQATARSLVQAALARKESVLSEKDTLRILAAYGLPVVEVVHASSMKEALVCAQKMGYPVALKIQAPELGRKSDVGGVVPNLETPEALRSAAAGIRRRIKRLRPDLQTTGFLLQKMIPSEEAHELIISVAIDPVFGPAILFGQAGVAMEVMADNAVGLPPLNMVLARDLINRTRISRLLAGYRNHPAANLDQLCKTLIQVSDLVIDLPELAELDITRLLVDPTRVLVLDARMRLVKAVAGERLAIRPYPKDLEESLEWQGARLILRPIKPEDAPQHLVFFSHLDPEDVRFRTFSALRELNPSRLARLTQIDYDREMAFIATRECGEGQFETLGVVRAVADPDNTCAEFGIMVRSDLKGKGLGRILFAKLLSYFRNRGTQEMVGDAMAHNTGVHDLVRRFGFEIHPVSGESLVRMRLNLQAGK
jgi:acetyltransferase